MVLAIIGLIEAALSLANTIIKRKYINRVDELKRAYLAEYNKPLAERSDAVLDNVAMQLQIAAESLAADLKLQATA